MPSTIGRGASFATALSSTSIRASCPWPQGIFVVVCDLSSAVITKGTVCRGLAKGHLVQRQQHVRDKGVAGDVSR